ncbi:PEP-CTERM sorting domain-containing protein [Aeoliella sp. ICT_H6.2]|uniref:PEP-CTERM sorting domain-containing protein n=1 Tax=Aeoliella straminimaris TaxID=2954799 RepID=A0A9X2FIZ2_9BACT|nr:PEP-CTERM sorting domain-containing protein [Aeoliella straminimaris]MCO6046516.1 PEP-CTERM sorting domain-containing protein [Aeoliella straminimaris]
MGQRILTIKRATCTVAAVLVVVVSGPASAEVTLTYREQEVKTGIRQRPSFDDRKLYVGLEPKSLTASTELISEEFGNVEYDRLQTADATITAQPTFDDQSNLTGFFGGGTLSASSPILGKTSATALFEAFFDVDSPTVFNFAMNELMETDYFRTPSGLFAGRQAWVDFDGPGSDYDIRWRNEGSTFTQLLQPGQYDIRIDFGAHATYDASPFTLDYFFLASFAAPDPVTPTWDEPAGGDFNIADNWSDDDAPTMSDDVRFDLPNTYTVDLQQDTQVGNMTVENGDVDLNYDLNLLKVAELLVAAPNGGAARLDVRSDTPVVSREHGLVADSITVGPGGALANTTIGQLFVGHVDFPPDSPEENQLLTDLQALEGLTVQGGGALATPAAKVDGPNADDGTGVATATVTGPGSMWQAITLKVGESSQGHVSVLDGGTITSPDVGPGPVLIATVDSASVVQESRLTVSGVGDDNGTPTPSQFLSSQITVGAEHRGRLTVDQGAVFKVDNLTLGRDDASRGFASVTGPDTKLMPANVAFANIHVGDDGFGQLDINDGATVVADLLVGSAPSFGTVGNNLGVVNVAGMGTTLTGGTHEIGRTNEGELNIADGAVLNTTTLRAGRFADSVGTVRIAGEGSQANVSFALALGGGFGFGVGEMYLSDGAAVVVDDEDAPATTSVGNRGYLEVAGGSTFTTGLLQMTGKLQVTGMDSHVTSNFGLIIESDLAEDEANLIVADGGKITVRGEYLDLRPGVTHVTGGGRIETARLFVGADASVVVQGRGSHLEADADLSLGPAADPTLDGGEIGVVGNLTVDAFGRVTADRLVLGPNGRVDGNGGVVAVGTQVANNGGFFNSGLLAAGASPGALTIDGDYIQEETGVLEIEIGGYTAGSEYDVLTITGDASIVGTVVFKFIDGFAPSLDDRFSFLEVDGTTDLSGVEYEIANLAPGFDYDVAAVNGDIQLVSLSDGSFVPEPATSVLFALGLLVGGFFSNGKRLLS